jgi:hypothetical protein
MPQTLLQPPQLLGSVVASTQMVLQSVRAPFEHTQVPDEQVSPAAVLQACPQLPQLLLSFDVVTQLPLQSVLPEPHAAHVEVEQERRAV